MTPTETPGITASAFTSALSLAANGVSIVTTTHAGINAGLTVSSMCSVCAEPALLLVCVNSGNEFCARAMDSGHFAVNILPTSCIELAEVFAGLGDGDDEGNRFDSGTWTQLATGSPFSAMHWWLWIVKSIQASSRAAIAYSLARWSIYA